MIWILLIVALFYIIFKLGEMNILKKLFDFFDQKRERKKRQKFLVQLQVEYGLRCPVCDGVVFHLDQHGFCCWDHMKMYAEQKLSAGGR